MTEQPQPVDVEAVVAHADALAAQGRTHDGEQVVLAALPAAPQDPRLHEALARCVLPRDRVLAVQAAQHAVSLAPDEPRALLNLSRILTPAGDVFELFHVEMAQDAISRALLVAPNDPDLLGEQARLHALMGRRGDAIRTAQRAASDDPSREPDDSATAGLTTMLVGSISWMCILGAGFGALNEETWGNGLGSQQAAARIACGVALALIALRVVLAWATYPRLTGRPRSWVRENYRAKDPIGAGWVQFLLTMIGLLVIGVAAGIPHLAATVAITTLVGQIVAAVIRARRLAKGLGA